MTSAAKRAIVALALLLAGCAHDDVMPLTRPKFPEPRQNVFNTPVSVVDSIDDDMMPTLAPAHGLIAYVSKQSGNLDIFVSSPATAAQTRLTTHTTDDSEPAFSPDGERIAWISQADDVKGDVWVMKPDGSDKKKLTGRDSGESRPAWSADGKTLYFTALGTGSVTPRVEALELTRNLRHVVVDAAWDPAAAPDASAIVYISGPEDGAPRLFAKRFSDGRVAALTDGAHLDAMPRFAVVNGTPTIFFTRFVDDTTSDGKTDTQDAPSIWSLTWNPAVFDGAPIDEARPLTAGAGGELFAVAATSWIVYTAKGFSNLEIYALPDDGVVTRNATPEAILQAARAEHDPAIRLLALRYAIAASKGTRGRARYELGRALEELGRYNDAHDELERAVAELGDTSASRVAQLERVRVDLLRDLHGVWELDVDSDLERLDEAYAATVAIGKTDSARPVQMRATTLRAEIELTRGRYAQALAVFEAAAAEADVSAEDGARALDHASHIYVRFGDMPAVEHTCVELIRRFMAERQYVEGCSRRWIELARTGPEGNAKATLEGIVRRYHELNHIAARATFALGEEQEKSGHVGSALASWQHVVQSYPRARSVVGDALMAIGETAEREHDLPVAIAAYEQLLAQFGSDLRIRGRARSGMTRIRLAKADSEEASGLLEQAAKSYAEVIQHHRKSAIAHRRYIMLSARLGRLHEVVAAYAKEAKEHPREAIARYAYGYALTFVRPLDLDAAAKEVEVALEVNPHLAAAHLTLGWIYMQREHRDPGRDWLDRAEARFRTAEQLVNVDDDPELWGAVELDRGNAFLELGKNDDAFRAYLARIQHASRFDSALTELVFYESFARAAWRMDELDVALDMAHEEWRLAQTIPGKPRQEVAAALQGAVYLQAGLSADAVTWFERAEALFRAREDWPRVVPMLRGKALALEALGRDDDALSAFAEVLDLTVRGIGVPAPHKPLFGFLAPEIPANPTDVTRAPYGFSAKVEEELSRAAASRSLLLRGDLRRARLFQDKRMALLDAAGRSIEERIQPELMHALNDSALLAVREGDLSRAFREWSEALDIGERGSYWPETATVLDSLATVWARAPRTQDASVVARAVQLAQAVRDATAESDVATSKRLARWLAMYELARVVATKPPVHAAADMQKGLDALDALNGRLDEAVKLASADPTLAAHLAAYAGVAVPTHASQARSDASWRTAFDDAVAKATVERAPLDGARLMPAIELFEANPSGRNAPERRLFLDAAVHVLAQEHDVERAWRLLERQRLTELAPIGRRNKIRSLSKTSTLTKALGRIPAELPQIREALESDAVLVQAFATRDDQWTWFVIDTTRLEIVKTPAMRDAALPDAVVKLLAGVTGTVYMDLGDLTATPARRLTVAGAPLEHAVEVLSATYLVAARESFRIVHGAPTTLSAGTLSALKTDGRDHVFVHLAMPGTANEPGSITGGDVQVTFAAPAETPESEVIDLDRIAGTSLRDLVVWLDAVPTSPRVARAIAQAFLVAGVPSIIVGEANADLLLAHASHDSATTLAATGALGATTRLIGYRGRDLSGRVDLAYDRFRGLSEAADVDLQRAKDSKGHDDWQRAYDDFRHLVSVIEFLEQPASTRALANSSAAGAAARAKDLPGELLALHDKQAQTLVGLGDVDGAVRLRESIAKTYSDAGDHEKELEQILAIGKAYLGVQRNDEAVRVLERCVDRARAEHARVVESDCLSRVGSAYRLLYRYDAAKQAYLAALAIDEHSDNQVYPRRNLGLLYEGALNDYDAALEQFTKALEQARKLENKRLVPMILLDIARTYRSRGDLGPALRSIREARAAMADNDRGNHTEAALEAATIALYRGNYPAAMDESTAALELARMTGNVAHEIQATSLVGLVELNRGKLQQAREAFTSALNLARGIDRRLDEAMQLVNLGDITQRQGDLDKAAQLYRQALAIDTELGSHAGQATANRALAALLQEQHKHDEALVVAQAAITAARQIGDRYNEAQALYIMARALNSSKRKDEAAEAYREAHELAVRMSVPEVQWRSLFALGRIDRDTGHRAEARERYEQALEVAERLSLAGADVRQEDGREALYADAIHLAYQDADVAGAFDLAERAQARNRLDLIDGADVVFPSDDSKHLVEAARHTREAILTAQRRRLRHPDATDIPSDSALKVEHAAAVAELMRRYPGIGRAFTIAPVQLAQLQEVLPSDAAVLIYTIGAKASDALIVRQSGPTHVDLTVTRAQLAPLTQQLREALRAFAPVEATNAEIAKLLLAPIEGALVGVTHLVIVPHGELVGVPFEALPWKNALVVDAMATSYTPSASLLVDVLAKPKRGPVARVAAVAYGSDLPFARLEALAVAGDAAIVDYAATETAVRALRADAVDIAAHGEVGADEPMKGALALARGANDDGRLELREIFGAPALAPLVSVSACTLGDVKTGWQALVSAFFATGTQTVIATEGRVSDLATGVLMKRFYHERKATGSDALRAAQLWTRQSFAHPGHWAELRLIGDFR